MTHPLRVGMTTFPFTLLIPVAGQPGLSLDNTTVQLATRTFLTAAIGIFQQQSTVIAQCLTVNAYQ